ncbi:MAG: hypothetical protein KGI61_02735 [Patescibacteria group bacterium]|nr:hypothetical protein [Patescibacteria group bacterium]MDE2011071.1 hypothetical protein [Patescibacteria group bacterium]
METHKKQSVPYQNSSFSHVKSLDQLLQERLLFEQVLAEVENSKPSYKYSTFIDDELINSLIRLGLAKEDRSFKTKIDGMGFKVRGYIFLINKINDLVNRVTGKNGRVKREALELITKDICERFTYSKIQAIFTDLNIPQSMFIAESKKKVVFYILSYYSTSSKQKDNNIFLKIIEEVLHPLHFNNCNKTAKQTEEEYGQILKYDRIIVQDALYFPHFFRH